MKSRDVGALSTEQARKANDLAEGLRRELTSEKESASAVEQQLSLATRRLDSVKGVLATTIAQYRAAVAKFRGETSAPPEEDSAYALASWLRRHLVKLPDLINGCTDYGVLAGVTNYAKLLARFGCTHTESIPEGVLPGPEALGETPPGLRKTLRNFIGFFWALFGRPAARKLAEEKRAKVFVLFLFSLAKLWMLLLLCVDEVVNRRHRRFWRAGLRRFLDRQLRVMPPPLLALRRALRPAVVKVRGRRHRLCPQQMWVMLQGLLLRPRRRRSRLFLGLVVPACKL